MKYSHGTLAAAKIDACTCGPCRAAERRYDARRRRLIAYGQWQPFVDADPVRAHLAALSQAGVGWMRAARLAGLSTSTVGKILYGDPQRGLAPSKRVRPTTAAAILAVKADLDTLADRAHIDGTGTRRRLQALVAVGWSQSKLAARLGMQRANFGKTIRASSVTARTARAVRVLYDDLWDQAPPEDTPRSRIAANRARDYARAHGWVSPLAWDDAEIDDPAARPRGVRKDTAA